MANNSTMAVIEHSRFIMARRRINIALCTLEDGIFDLFTTENVVELLNNALSDLESVSVVEQDAKYQVGRGLDWNAHSELVSE